MSCYRWLGLAVSTLAVLLLAEPQLDETVASPLSPSRNAEIRVAVATNFTAPIEELVVRFKQQTGNKVVPVFGSTGKHYAQIKNGAPFDAFFAADAARPKRLEDDSTAVPGSRFTYAIGRLILWSPRTGLVDSAGAVLGQDKFHYLALPNPVLAPYGRAAQQVLEKRGLWDRLQSRIVRGENIGQTYQFIKSGNAELGFVACSQVMPPGQLIVGSYWVVDSSLYNPIEQQCVLLNDNPVARAFLEYVRSDEAKELIRGFGYRTE